MVNSTFEISEQVAILSISHEQKMELSIQYVKCYLLKLIAFDLNKEKEELQSIFVN